MTPVPEPAGDIRAQLAAVMDPAHPKQTCFMVPADAERLKLELLPEGVYAVTRVEGTLITRDHVVAYLFDNLPDDTDADSFDIWMADMLGYPEAKPYVVESCGGNPAERARAVQARDAAGHVVHEAFASPLGFLDTVTAVYKHVPPGGELVILSPVGAIARRIAMRWVQS